MTSCVLSESRNGRRFRNGLITESRWRNSVNPFRAASPTKSKGDGKDFWKEFDENNWIFTGAPKSHTPWPQDSQSEVTDGYPLKKPKPGDIVLVRQGKTTGKGIGIVHRNDYREALADGSRLHVLWLNKKEEHLEGGQFPISGFSQAGQKTIKLFETAPVYSRTMQLVKSIDSDEELTRAAVLHALSEYDEIGGDAFLRKYGRLGSRTYWIIHQGKRYHMKAVWGAAYEHAGMQQPHRSRGTCKNSIVVAKLLENLEFAIEHEGGNNGGSPGAEDEEQAAESASVFHEKNRILYGPPGTGKTWNATNHALAIIDGVEVQNVDRNDERFHSLRFDPGSGGGQIAMVTFHQNFAYEEFVEGIRPRLKTEGKPDYELHEGFFRRMARAAQERPDDPFVLIIDEINRGNIAKIFGELITLIEDSRRIGSEDESFVTLPYSGDPFGVPGNLYVIGTMNTADRSIQLLDTALRRRFTFIEMMPVPDHDLIPPDLEGIDCRRMLKAMNDRITALLDREHQIGHTYLFHIAGIEELAGAFQNRIFPLLQEYFFHDWSKIREVLGGNSFVHERNTENELREVDKRNYDRLPHSDSKWRDPTEYKRIYETGHLSNEGKSGRVHSRCEVERDRRAKR